MSDLFDDLNKILKKDLFPILVKYFKDPNNKITDNLNDFFNNSQTLLKDIFDIFSKNKVNDNDQRKYTDIENVIDIDPAEEDDYDILLRRLTLIEENMNKMAKILKDKN